jgi:ACT domain-containing protein
MSDKKVLSELHVNLLGKLFLGACAAWVIGKVTNTKIRGTEEEVNAVYNAMVASRRFQNELQHPGATVSSVMDKLKLKNASAQEFERILGIKWPL